MKKDTIIGIVAFIIVFIVTAIVSYNVFDKKGSTVSIPTATSTATSTSEVVIATSTPAITPPAFTRLKGFYIALEDNGNLGKEIGCEDSVVGIDYTVPYTQSPLRVSLETLLKEKNQQVGNAKLYNSLAQSNLTLAGLNLSGGLATIHLEGQIALGGTCDTPRFESQIEETARQFSSVSNVAIFLNGTPIDEALSSR